jgi:rubredoxin
MAVWRCSVCLTNFPVEHPGALCPICVEGELDFVYNDSPDEDWETKTRHAQFDRYYEKTRGTLAQAD